MRYLECDPEIDATPAPDRILVVEPFGYRYLITEDGKVIEQVVGIKSIVDRLHRRVFLQSIEDYPRAGVLHAAALRRRDQRLLLVGGSSAGKTSLALRLIQAGFAIEGDEHVFVEEDGVIARPRACRVKETSIALFPASTAKVIAAAPHYVDDYSHRTFNVDPRLIGGAWRIEKGGVDAIIILQPNYGGYSSLRPMRPLGLSQTLLSEFGLRETGRGASIGAVAQLVRRTQGFDLSLGDHETAIKCIERALKGHE